MIPRLAEFRCFADVESLVPGEVVLSEEESRHVAQVRRAGPGTPVSLLNGRGAVGEAFIERVEKRHTILRVEQVRMVSAPEPELTLAIGALKQAAWDEVLKHAVELGVNRVLRVQSQHSVSELDGGKAESKLARMRERLIQAAKQSANPWLPELLSAASLEEAFSVCPANALQLLASLRTPAAAGLCEFLRQQEGGPRVLWIGPEGDFSASEEAFLLSKGAQALSLGPRILRAETAALSLCGAIRLWGDIHSPVVARGAALDAPHETA
jgi:16S rRNA (uracil1498-N3)-methyltransferase